MKLRVLLCVLVVLCSATLATSQKAESSNNSETQRYQFVTAKVETTAGNGEVNTLFLLDTTTGKVWRYQPLWVTKKDQKQEVQDELFIPIGFAEYSPKGKPSPPR